MGLARESPAGFTEPIHRVRDPTTIRPQEHEQMSILGNIMSSIFGGQQTPPPGASPQSLGGGFEGMTKPAASAAPTPASPQAPAQPQGQAPSQARPSAPAGQVDVAAVLDKLAREADQKLEWRKSIVDMMKLLKMDSSFNARKKLAQELHYTGDTKDSAAMNGWLHKQVMRKLSESGGKVPSELKH
jgi:pyruvate/2-oxoglutarate dehydrogenase complex dihydrolipoamide acyltransferase (E2) component